MRGIGRTAARMLRCGALLSLFVFAPLGAHVALAVAPSGACCLEGGVCEDLLDFQCEEQGGDFIGSNTSCASVHCDASLAAPLISIFGLVALIGGLGGFGLFRLLASRSWA